MATRVHGRVPEKKPAVHPRPAVTGKVQRGAAAAPARSSADALKVRMGARKLAAAVGAKKPSGPAAPAVQSSGAPGGMKQSDVPGPAVQPGEVAAAIERRTSWGVLDPSALGADLLAAAEGGRFSFCSGVLDALSSRRRDDVSLGFMEHLPADTAGEKRLDALAASNAGRRLLDRLFDELTSGRIGGDERQQAGRILEAKQRAIPAAAAGTQPKMVFPFLPPGLLAGSGAPISARRLPDGRIWVKQPVHVRFTEKFSNETGTLPDKLFVSGIEIPENTMVGVKRYDDDGKRVDKPALYLVQLSNETEKNTADEAVNTVILAAGLIGSGGALLGRAGAREIVKDVGKTFGELRTWKGLVQAGKDAWKPFLASGFTSGASNAFFQWYYGTDVSQLLRKEKLKPIILDFALGGAFGMVIARVWKKIPLDPKLSPKYIWNEIFQEARNWAPLREAAWTLVKQQIVLSPVQGVLNLTRAVVLDTDRLPILKVGLVDFFLGMAASYILQFAQLGRAGDLWWGAPVPPKTVYDRLNSFSGATMRSVFGQIRQAGIRTSMGLAPIKDRDAAETIKSSTDWLVNLKESQLGAELLFEAEQGNFSFGLNVLNQLGRPERDDVSLAFMEHLPEDAEGEKRLDALAADEGGLQLLNRLHAELTTGIVFADERRQAARIVAAKSRRKR